jgi:hypothetical protein
MVLTMILTVHQGGMIYMRRMMKILLLTLVLLVMATSRSNAQAPSYDLTRSLKHYTFKGTHNSYETEVVGTLSNQLDGLNVWGIEIDMCGINDEGRLQVKHGAEPGSSLLFRNIMSEVRQTNTFQKRARIVFLWLDVKEQVLSECRWRDFSDDGRANLMQAEIEAFLGGGDASIFYTNADWNNDGRRWPSIQELLSRRKYFIPIYDNNDHNPNHPFFFVTAVSLEEANRIGSHVAFINKKDVDLEGDRISPTDQYLWRSYGVNSRDEWERGAQLGFNLLSTDEVAAEWTFTLQTHPPVPVFVDARAPSCTFYFCLLQSGSYLYPFGTAKLSHATSIVPAQGSLIVAPGSYRLDGTLMIKRPMVIEVGQTGYAPTSGPAIIGQ